MLVKPNFEKPMDSAKDVLDRGITILWFPYYEYYKDMQLQQNDSMILKKLAEKVYIAKVSNNQTKLKLWQGRNDFFREIGWGLDWLSWVELV